MGESKRHRDLDPFENLRPPCPPEELRGRVLVAAAANLPGASRSDLWARLWFNRPLRLAWCAVAALLVAGHVLITPARRLSETAPAHVRLEFVAELDPELLDIVDLPRISEDALVGLP